MNGFDVPLPRRVRLSKVDAMIDNLFMPKRCLPNLRGSCECGHIHSAHEGHEWRLAGGGGRCRGILKHGGRRRCPCEKFVPKSYEKEQLAFRDKLRKFAFQILREVA